MSLCLVVIAPSDAQEADVKKMGEACLINDTYDPALVSAVNPEAIQDQSHPWYALKVRCGGEVNVAATLKDRGFDPYCPTRKERRQYSDRMKVVTTPLFPGYVLCQFDAQRKLPIISTPGVEYVVGSAGAPTPIPSDEVANIQRMVDAGATPTNYLSRGQRVQVVRGALKGVEGILVRDSSGGQLVVSIELLSQSAALHISEDAICPLEQVQ